MRAPSTVPSGTVRWQRSPPAPEAPAREAAEATRERILDAATDASVAPDRALRQAAFNVEVRESVPHARLLPSSSALGTHCGHGTAIRRWPMASPWSMGRGQNEVAARVVAAGAGKKLKSGASPRSIARAVRQVLDDPSYREAAVRMAAAIAKEAVEDRALVELEALADGSREPVRA